MNQTKMVRGFLLGFLAAIVLVVVTAAATSNGPGPGRYQMKTIETPVASIVVLDTHTGEVRYTGVGGAGGGQEIGSIDMFAEAGE